MDRGRAARRRLDDAAERGERRHERDVLLLDHTDRLLVQQRRVLDRVDAGLGRDAHSLYACVVMRAGAVGLFDGRARLLRRVHPELAKLSDDPY